MFQGVLMVSCETTHSKVAVEETTMNLLSLRSDPTVETVQYLIDLYDKIGIPHFQHGLVWNDENTSLLLESLHFDSPCGIIILWKPREPSKEGVPLSKLRDPECLVIDGQQRIRCLRNALGPGTERSIQSSSEDEGDESGEIGEPDAPRVWCLNLPRVPEHIVPYKWLEKLYNIEKRGRVSRHPVNNIGNITYISHDLNHWKTGLGSETIDLKREPPHNLECHFLGTEGKVGDAYEKVKKEMAKNKDTAARETAKRAFEEFCGRRRKLIAEMFVEWLKELECDLTNLRRVEPEALVNPSREDRVRTLDYQADIEDAVLGLIADR